MKIPKRIARYPDLKKRGITNSRVTLSRWIEKYGFPRPYQLGPNSIGWDEDEVDAWLEQRKAVRAQSGEAA